MTLLELLVQELPKRGGWEFSGDTVFQDYDGEIRVVSNECTFSGLHLALCDCYRESGFSQVTLPEHALVTREQYEAALAASKQVAWDGEGLPPVGMKVEWLSEIYGWIDGTVAGHDEKYPQVAIIRHNGGYAVCNRHEIRTEADRRRDDVIKQMAHSLRANGNVTNEQIGRLYDDISNGNIFGIKLAD